MPVNLFKLKSKVVKTEILNAEPALFVNIA